MYFANSVILAVTVAVVSVHPRLDPICDAVHAHGDHHHLPTPNYSRDCAN